MDRDVIQAAGPDGGIHSSARWLARKAWLVRAAAVTFLVGGGVVAYLLFSAA